MESQQPLRHTLMEVFICPREWTHSTQRFTPTHLVSLQDPGTTPETITAYRPSWIAAENHFHEFFYDVDSADHPRAPAYAAIQKLLLWLDPRCGPGSPHRFLIHCDAGLGRSPAVGYLAWALHLGPGREEEAFDRMVASALNTRLIPNSIIIAHADDLLNRRGQLLAPLHQWNQRAPWARRR